MSYPEHDKLQAVQDDSNVIGTFLDTCGYTLCEWLNPADMGDEDEPHGYFPVRGSINQILAKHFEIDLDKLEAEKRQMLDAQRALNRDVARIRPTGTATGQ